MALDQSEIVIVAVVQTYTCDSVFFFVISWLFKIINFVCIGTNYYGSITEYIVYDRWS